MPPDNEPDLRDAIGSALDAADEPPVTGDETPPAAGPAEAPDTPAEPPSGERQRDALGRFASPTGGPATATPQAPTAPVTPPVGQPQAQPGAVPPPVSWTPMARETWAQLPPVAQQEIARREGEIARAMTENASARQIAQAFSDAATPYLGRMRMQGVNPIQAFDNLLATEMTLGQGSMAQKAETIARLVKAYGVDIEALDSALAGQPLPQQVAVDAQVQALVQQQMAPFQQFLVNAQAAQQQRYAEVETEVGNELEAFAADSSHEFFEHVRDIMGDLVEVASKHKMSLSLQDAYDRAVLLHPQTRAVVEARQRAEAAQGLNGAAQRARRAAVSVAGTPALGAPDDAPADLDLRGALSAAIDAHTRV